VSDQIGFGSRADQALHFYERYPQWSLMGRMVADTRAAIDAVRALTRADRSRIYVVGLGMGAQVGLITAAFDDRIAGVATITGLGSLRSAEAAVNTEGIRRYSHLHGLMPKLGFFVGRENRLPIDFDEVLAAIAPRPVLSVAPTMDRYYLVEDVRRLAAAVEPVYRMLGPEGASALGVEMLTPKEFSRFPNEIQKLAYDWIVLKAGK
jgi:pimeloyl-ACP methyl ester carboxylesterase